VLVGPRLLDFHLVDRWSKRPLLTPGLVSHSMPFAVLIRLRLCQWRLHTHAIEHHVFVALPDQVKETLPWHVKIG